MHGRRAFVGLATVAVGAALLTERIGGTAQVLRLLRHWWPLAIVALGAFNLVRMAERRWALAGPLLTIAVGIGLLTWISHLIGHEIFPLLWPAALMLLGAILVLSGAHWGSGDLTRRRELRRTVWLRGERIASRARPFWYATITVVLGHLQLDLREAQLHPQGAFVNLNLLFGTVELLVRNDTRVRVRRPFFLGGTGPRESDPPSSPLPPLTISVLGLLGTVTLETTAPADSSSEPGHYPY